jgi:hypothetical protein
VLGASQRLHFGFHHSLGRKCQYLANEIRIGGLFNQAILSVVIVSSDSFICFAA